MDDEPIAFDCAIRQVKTMVDHSFNVTLNLPEYCAPQVARLLSHIEDFARVALVFDEGLKDDRKSTKRNRF